MDRRTLSWRVEEACMNAWPSPRQVLMDGWLLRASGGPIRRTNSVNPLQGGGADPGAIIAACKAIYGALGQDTLFRIPDVAGMAARLDPTLAARGFEAEGTTLCLYADLAAAPARPHPGVVLAPGPTAAWLSLRTGVNGEREDAARVFQAMTGLIALPKTFAALYAEDRIAAVAYGAIDRELLVVESVATDAAFRGRGLATGVVSALMAWAAGHGARGACLQVAAANTPALTVYRKLGFTVGLHSYHYRRKARV